MVDVCSATQRQSYVIEFSAVVEFSTCGVDFSATVGIFGICCVILCNCRFSVYVVGLSVVAESCMSCGTISL